MTLGEQIKNKRELKNMSQEDLADQLNVSRQAVSKWENNLAVPHGINRELLMQVLELEIETSENDAEANQTGRVRLWTAGGWIMTAILIAVFFVIFLMKPRDLDKANTTEAEPAIKSIVFYDNMQKEVQPDAYWYNAAQIDSILIQWEGGMPDTIKVFAIPQGTNTIAEKEMLFEKKITEQDNVILINADFLKGQYMAHIYFELDFNGQTVTTESYNIMMEELDSSERLIMRDKDMIYKYATAVTEQDIEKYIALFLPDIQNEMKEFISRNDSPDAFFREKKIEIVLISAIDESYISSYEASFADAEVLEEFHCYYVEEDIQYKEAVLDNENGMDIKDGRKSVLVVIGYQDSMPYLYRLSEIEYDAVKDYLEA